MKENILKKTFRFRNIIFISVLLFIIACSAGPPLLESFLIVESSVNKADALVLMAGSSSHRLPAVVKLYKTGIAPRILLTNDGNKGAWSKKYQRNLSLVEWAGEYLRHQGVPKEAIKLLNFSESGSYYDALNTRAYVSANHSIDTLLVVTSDYHTRRTLWTFNRVFADLDVQIGVYPVPEERSHTFRHLKTLSVELIKLLFYRIRYSSFSC